MRASLLAGLASLASTTFAYDQEFAWDINTIVETRSLDEIHEAALKEGGVVTLWHGGAASDQEDFMKKGFEKRFPGMTLNVSVSSSNYHGPNIDRQLATGTLYVDSAALQTTQYYPRWKEEGALLNYKPHGFEQAYDTFKDLDGAWTGYTINGWSFLSNKQKLSGEPPRTFLDFLKPEYKDKIVLCYPNEDDAILHTFDLIMSKYGLDYFDSLQNQNPKWVRGAYLPAVYISDPNSTYATTFTTTLGLVGESPLDVFWPEEGAQFTSWAQPIGIFKDAPHPESAKLLQNYLLTPEFQNLTSSWSIRRNVESPYGFPGIFEMPNTDPTHFQVWMADRARVERMRFWFEDKLGYPKGSTTP